MSLQEGSRTLMLTDTHTVYARVQTHLVGNDHTFSSEIREQSKFQKERIKISLLPEVK